MFQKFVRAEFPIEPYTLRFLVYHATASSEAGGSENLANKTTGEELWVERLNDNEIEIKRGRKEKTKKN